MKFTDYMDSVKDVPVSDKLEYTIAVMWLHPGRLPLGVVSLGDETMPVIKIPARAQYIRSRRGEAHRSGDRIQQKGVPRQNTYHGYYFAFICRRIPGRCVCRL